MPDARWLQGREADAWRAVRDLGQPLWTALGRDLQHDSGLSLADYQVLVVLSAAPDGVLGYREVAQETGWEKSRLSHHLTRMEQRNLVQRQECPGDARSANVVLTDSGRSAIQQAAPGHVASVRRLLIDRLSAEQIATLAAIGDAVRDAVQCCPDLAEGADGPGAGDPAEPGCRAACPDPAGP
jgi:DNA-binding MarR family transcriptional regulator